MWIQRAKIPDCERNRNTQAKYEPKQKHDIRFPYIPATFCDLTDLKSNLRLKSCANNATETNVKQWGDIINTNRPNIMDSNGEQNVPEKTEIRFGGIQVTYEVDGVSWEFAKCPYGTM